MGTVAVTGNYLRVRGEYGPGHGHRGGDWELPPRARRILQDEIDRGQELGTTSACAENTNTQASLDAIKGNYLRVRGEYRSPHADH